MNFLGTKDIKISFDFNGTKIIEFDSERIESFLKLNIQDQRVHNSVLNGTVIKEHLGFYHEIKTYFHNITESEYENTLRYLEYVDVITIYPFRDNTVFSINCIVKKAYPYEYSSFNGSRTAFYLEAISNSYSELGTKPIFIEFNRISAFQFPAEQVEIEFNRITGLV